MKQVYRIVLCVAVLAGVSACDKKADESGESGGPDPAEMLGACLEIRDQMQSGALAFEDGFSKLTGTCGEACDLNPDSEACAEAEKAIDTLCGVSPESCVELCETFDSPTLKDLACNFDPNAEPEGGEVGGGDPASAPEGEGLAAAIECQDVAAKVAGGERKLGDALAEMMEVCEAGCDAEHAPSCASLERLMAAFCQVKPETCQKICQKEPDRTVGKHACSPPELPVYRSQDEQRAAALCHKMRLEIDSGATTLADAIAADMHTLCATACDADDEAACAEAKVAVPAFCEAKEGACEGKCDTMPDGTLRDLYGCEPLGGGGDTPEARSARCAHQVKLAASGGVEARDGVGTLCAEACDANPEDGASCEAAKGAFEAMCKEMPGFCKEQCGKWDSPTTNRYICEFAGMPVPGGAAAAPSGETAPAGAEPSGAPTAPPPGAGGVPKALLERSADDCKKMADTAAGNPTLLAGMAAGMITLCGFGCDAGDEASCASLEAAAKAVCEDPAACEKACAQVHPSSVSGKAAVCK